MTSRKKGMRDVVPGLRMIAVLALVITTVITTAAGVSAQGSDTVDVAIYTQENGFEAYDACYLLVGYSQVGCDENRDGRVMFADIPYGTYTVRQTADLGPGRHVADFTIQVTGEYRTTGGWQSFYATVVTTGGAAAQPSGGMVVGVSLACDDVATCGTAFNVQVSVTTYDGTFLGACTVRGNLLDRSHVPACGVDFAFQPTGTLIVTQDVSTLPAGYAPTENPMYVDTTHLGRASHDVIFTNTLQQGRIGTSRTSDVAIVTTENGQPAYDACYVLVDHSNEGCDENRDGKITFEDIPLGTYTVRQTANLGPSRSVPDFTIQVTGAISPDGWERFGTTIVSDAAPSGAVDIALITRDPNTGDLLTGTCYVLVGYSNEGCDENADGQVTFADIPFDTYTVRQTRTPAGYPTINDYDIDVWPLGNLPDGSVLEVPLGFIVKQAPQQNAPGTLNVSVVLIDYATGEKLSAGVCVELVGGSNVGCDDDLADGQIDFLDVPSGGPYELRFSNLPAGWQAGIDGQPYFVTIDPQPGTRANLFAFVLLMPN